MAIQMTLLEMTQKILSSMDSDEINSISDTTEAQQVVDILEQTYYDIAATVDFPDNWSFFQLEASEDVTKPTLMKLPDNVGKLEWVRYDSSETSDTKRDWAEVCPLVRTKFFERMESLDSNDSDVYHFDLAVGSFSFDVRGYNNKKPVYYTTVDDKYLLFDNFDDTIGNTILGSHTRCYGMLIPVFLREDSYVPEFEPRQFTLFYNEAKSQAWTDLKQVTNQKAEQRARRGWISAQRKEPRVDGVGDIKESFTPDYGRRHR